MVVLDETAWARDVAIGVRAAIASGDLAGLGVLVVSVMDYGAKGDGVTDDTAAIQAALTATPVGGVCFFPAAAPGKFYRAAGALTGPAGITLAGAGWYWLRDNLGVFGAGANAVRTNYGGAVIVSEVVAGSALTCATGVTEQGANLQNLLIVGPGAGAATGVTLGHAAHAPVENAWLNVGIINFAVGASFLNVEEGLFSGLRILGCTTGLALATATNANAFDMLDIQKCGSALTIDVTCQANAFVAPTFQANSGTVVSVNGKTQSFYNPYFENPGCTRAIDFVAGKGHTLHAPKFANASDTVRVQAAAISTYLYGLVDAPTVANVGSSTVILGDATNLADTGTNTYVYDPINGTWTVPPWFNNLVLKAGGTIKTGRGATGARPAAATVGFGAMFYDASLAKPIWSDGANWRDAMANVV